MAGTASVKIDELLKPKELLLLSMTFEEADEWFRNFQAFLKHNERALAKQDILVIHALLNKSIEAKLSSTLGAHPDVEATKPIADRNGCLDKLRSMFIKKNPLWLRRHHYFMCIQQKGETVNDWWVKKTDKARECQLDTITVDDLRLLELIRGMHLFKLRQEFLRTKDQTLDGLLQIARNW